MDFLSQIKAARAILGWSQVDLAQAADLSVPNIQLLETGKSHPTSRTQNKIIFALRKQGIVFTEKGVEHEEFPIYFTSGKTHEEAYLKLLDDVLEYLPSVKNPELLVLYGNDKVSPPSVNDRYRELRSKGVKMRQLIEEDNRYIIGPLQEYRYIPKEYFLNRVTLVYGDRIANETSDVKKGIIRVDPANAAIQRNTFNILWNVLRKPNESIADDRF